MKTDKQMRGFSLIELMIALTISMILMAGVVNIMISSKRAYHVQNEMRGLLENARFAMELLSNDLRMAGYFGCALQTPAGVMPLAGRNDVSEANNSDIIQIAFMDSNQNAFSVEHCPRKEQGTDPCLLSPNPLMATPLQMGTKIFNSSTQFMVRGELFVDDIVVASDCGGSSIYTVQSVSATGVTLNAGLDRDYDNRGLSYGAELRRVLKRRYFIAESDNGFSLFGDDKTIDAVLETADEYMITQGIENLQIRYGVDTDDDQVVNQYVNSDGVADMRQVVGIRITLLANTITERFDREKDVGTYSLDPEVNYDPADDYRRRAVFTTTVKLRNI